MKKTDRTSARYGRDGKMTPRRSNALDRRQQKLERQWEQDRAWQAGVERVRHGVDRPMLIIILVLLCIGIVMVFSASFPYAIREGRSSMYYGLLHLAFAGVGLVLMMIAALAPYHVYKSVAPILFYLTVILLLLVPIIGVSHKGAKRWLPLGPLGQFQPSEIAKFALTMMLAWYIDKHYAKSSTRLSNRDSFVHGVLVPGLILATICGLVLIEKHLSGMVILAAIGVCVIFLSGANIGQMALCYGTSAVVAITAYLLKNSYALQRILTHSDENADALVEAWQTTQGLFAIGSGGLLGVGLGESRLKYNYVSEAHNDFVFTIWCEEMGFVGAVLVVGLYVLFIWRGVTIAKKAPDTFSSLVAFGITCQVGIQAFLNIMVVTAVIPNTGISLPFCSYGGTSLMILLAEMGVLLSISKHSFQKK